MNRVGMMMSSSLTVQGGLKKGEQLVCAGSLGAVQEDHYKIGGDL